MTLHFPPLRKLISICQMYSVSTLILSIRKRTFSFSRTANNDKGRTTKGELGTGFPNDFFAESLRYTTLKQEEEEEDCDLQSHLTHQLQL